MGLCSARIFLPYPSHKLGEGLGERVVVGAQKEGCIAKMAGGEDCKGK